VTLHSGLPDGERRANWAAAARGEADLVLGTRLAVFAPLPRLALIVVDEEHDASYKQQDGVRYHARDAAVWRAHRLGIPVVLGSATPSLESYAHARAGRPARIRAKLNALVDLGVIEALYEASRAGVPVDLLVRGVCCLVPGVPGASETIRVHSVVGRFLEHSRIYYFENACQPQVFISSADWMPRNFFRRIELAIPVEDGVLRERLISEVLAVSLADNAKARFLQPDGSYRRATAASDGKSCRSQVQFMAAATSGEQALRKPVDGRTRYPLVKLAPSPFAARKRKK